MEFKDHTAIYSFILAINTAYIYWSKPQKKDEDIKYHEKFFFSLVNLITTVIYELCIYTKSKILGELENKKARVDLLKTQNAKKNAKKIDSKIVNKIYENIIHVQDKANTYNERFENQLSIISKPVYFRLTSFYSALIAFLVLFLGPLYDDYNIMVSVFNVEVHFITMLNAIIIAIALNNLYTCIFDVWGPNSKSVFKPNYFLFILLYVIYLILMILLETRCNIIFKTNHIVIFFSLSLLSNFIIYIISSILRAIRISGAMFIQFRGILKSDEYNDIGSNIRLLNNVKLEESNITDISFD